MDKKRSLYISSILLLISFGIRLITDYLQTQNFWNLDAFTEIARSILLLSALVIFLGVFLGGSKKSATPDHPGKFSFSWCLGFSIPLFIVLGVVYYVNPHARFTRDVYPSITPSARSIKTEAYKNLVDEPDIVIFGSSRAFTISPSYIEKKTGYRAFNMSVEGGRTGDYAVQLNYIMKSGLVPDVLIVEVGIETFAKDYFDDELQPLSLIPNMPFNMAYMVAGELLEDIFSVQSLSDSAYVVTLSDVEKKSMTWTFKPDGMGERKSLTHDQYLRLLASTIEGRLNSLFCTQINYTAMKILKETLGLAETKGVAVILYESPMHGNYLERGEKENPEGYAYCRTLIRNAISSLTKSYPNVFFRDLSEYDTVSNLGENGFYDAVHLRPDAAELVVDALIPEMISAMMWSREIQIK